MGRGLSIGGSINGEGSIHRRGPSIGGSINGEGVWVYPGLWSINGGRGLSMKERSINGGGVSRSMVFQWGRGQGSIHGGRGLDPAEKKC
jgi:hypothetical protein